MKKGIIIILTLFVINCVHGQDTKPELKTLSIIQASGTPEVKTYNLVVEPTDISSLNILSDSEGQQKYGVQKGTTVAVVTLKPNVKLIKVPELLKTFKVDAKYQDLKIRLDGKNIAHQDDILLEGSAIHSVNVNLEENLIDITTKASARSVEKSGRSGKETIRIR